MSLITLPHAVFLYDEDGNAVPVVSGSAITSGSRGFIIFGEDGNGVTRQFSVDTNGQLAIQNPANLDVALSTRLSEATFTGSFDDLLTRVGEVSETPTGNTVLGRLKDLDDHLSSSLGSLGQKEMTGSTPVVIASDQTSVLVESVISDHSGSFANIVTNGTRTALSIEYPALLAEMKLITRELKIIRQHMEVITEEEWDGDC